MDLLGLFLSSAIQAAAPAAACPVPPPVYVAVLLDDAAVQTRSDFSLAQIEAMRRQADGAESHPTLGFYAHRFGYTVKVELDRAPDNPCAKSVQIGVRMVLSERVIEIGRDLAGNPCLFSIARAHYERHAAADDAVFSNYARMLGPALRGAPLLPQQRDYAVEMLDKAQIEKLTNDSIDVTLASYEAARRTAQGAVDTKNEAVKMSTGCTARTPTEGHI